MATMTKIPRKPNEHAGNTFLWKVKVFEIRFIFSLLLRLLTWAARQGYYSYMIKARISELKNKLSYYLKLVQRGEEIEVLDRDRPVARIVRISASEKKAASDLLKQMERDGVVHLGTGGLSPLLLTNPPGKGARVLEAVLEDREDR